MNNAYLAHHGILGMKWGVRRSEAQLARARGHSSKPSDDKNEVAARKVAVKKVTYEGVLQVTDPEQFRALLCQGMGRGKAYGLGLMTVMRGGN